MVQKRRTVASDDLGDEREISSLGPEKVRENLQLPINTTSSIDDKSRGSRSTSSIAQSQRSRSKEKQSLAASDFMDRTTKIKRFGGGKDEPQPDSRSVGSGHKTKVMAPSAEQPLVIENIEDVGLHSTYLHDRNPAPSSRIGASSEREEPLPCDESVQVDGIERVERGASGTASIKSNTSLDARSVASSVGTEKSRSGKLSLSRAPHDSQPSKHHSQPRNMLLRYQQTGSNRSLATPKTPRERIPGLLGVRSWRSTTSERNPPKTASIGASLDTSEKKDNADPDCAESMNKSTTCDTQSVGSVVKSAVSWDQNPPSVLGAVSIDSAGPVGSTQRRGILRRSKRSDSKKSLQSETSFDRIEGTKSWNTLGDRDSSRAASESCKKQDERSIISVTKSRLSLISSRQVTQKGDYPDPSPLTVPTELQALTLQRSISNVTVDSRKSFDENTFPSTKDCTNDNLERSEEQSTSTSARDTVESIVPDKIITVQDDPSFANITSSTYRRLNLSQSASRSLSQTLSSSMMEASSLLLDRTQRSGSHVGFDSTASCVRNTTPVVEQSLTSIESDCGTPSDALAISASFGQQEDLKITEIQGISLLPHASSLNSTTKPASNAPVTDETPTANPRTTVPKRWWHHLLDRFHPRESVAEEVTIRSCSDNQSSPVEDSTNAKNADDCNSLVLKENDNKHPAEEKIVPTLDHDQKPKSLQNLDLKHHLGEVTALVSEREPLTDLTPSEHTVHTEGDKDIMPYKIQTTESIKASSGSEDANDTQSAREDSTTVRKRTASICGQSTNTIPTSYCMLQQGDTKTTVSDTDQSQDDFKLQSDTNTTITSDQETSTISMPVTDDKLQSRAITKTMSARHSSADIVPVGINMLTTGAKEFRKSRLYLRSPQEVLLSAMEAMKSSNTQLQLCNEEANCMYLHDTMDWIMSTDYKDGSWDAASVSCSSWDEGVTKGVPKQVPQQRSRPRLLQTHSHLMESQPSRVAFAKKRSNSNRSTYHAPIGRSLVDNDSGIQESSCVDDHRLSCPPSSNISPQCYIVPSASSDLIPTTQYDDCRSMRALPTNDSSKQQPNSRNSAQTSLSCLRLHSRKTWDETLYPSDGMHNKLTDASTRHPAYRSPTATDCNTNIEAGGALTRASKLHKNKTKGRAPQSVEGPSNASTQRWKLLQLRSRTNRPKKESFEEDLTENKMVKNSTPVRNKAVPNKEKSRGDIPCKNESAKSSKHSPPHTIRVSQRGKTKSSDTLPLRDAAPLVADATIYTAKMPGPTRRRTLIGRSRLSESWTTSIKSSTTCVCSPSGDKKKTDCVCTEGVEVVMSKNTLENSTKVLSNPTKTRNASTKFDEESFKDRVSVLLDVKPEIFEQIEILRKRDKEKDDDETAGSISSGGTLGKMSVIGLDDAAQEMSFVLETLSMDMSDMADKIWEAFDIVDDTNGNIVTLVESLSGLDEPRNESKTSCNVTSLLQCDCDKNGMKQCP